MEITQVSYIADGGIYQTESFRTVKGIKERPDTEVVHSFGGTIPFRLVP